MPEVYIDSLTLKNFGPYYGENTFNFTTHDDRCGILIGGKNGAGKTHLLRALYLAVTGETGVHDLKKVEPSSEATRFVFEKSLNRRAEAEGEDTSLLQVTLSQRDAKGSRKVTIAREIRHRPNSGPVWTSWADRLDGSGRIDDQRHLEALRDAFLPRHLARFFFFDAERGQNFNLGQQEIVEGISRILGLWSYGELETDLRQLIQNKIPRVFNSSEGHEAARKLAEITGQIVTAQNQLINVEEELNGVTVELRESEEELADVEERLKSLGAVDPAELQRTQENRIKLSETKSRLEAELTNAWELEMPLALLGTYRQKLHDYLVQEEKRREWETSKAAVEPKIPQVKRDVFDDVPQVFRLPVDVFAFYNIRLEQALHRLFHPPPQGMAERAYVTNRNDHSAQIRALLAAVITSVGGVAELCTNAEATDADIRKLDTQLKQLKQDAAAMELGVKLHQDRGRLINQCDGLKTRLEGISGQKQSLQAKLAELRREETNLTAVTRKARRGQTLISLAARYREAATEIRSRAADQLRREISEHVGELWVKIVDRPCEFLGMDFDKNWNCLLMRRDGKKIPWEEINTSAGQRQVRMLAFYEALRQLAKLAPPLVVDTPLGRLDNEVKDTVLDKLYLTGHQTIILTTNSEIDPKGSHFNRIQEKIARAYTLRPLGREGSQNYEVEVTNDYFGEKI